MRSTRLLLAALIIPVTAQAWEMTVWPEFFRPDPFGEVVKADVSGEAPALPLKVGQAGPVRFTAARNGYVSFHVSIKDEAGGTFSLKATAPSGVEVDLFREWFHRHPKEGHYIPEALIPLKEGTPLSLPDPEMKIPNQKVVAVWVDVWVSKQARAGPTEISIELTAGQKKQSLRVGLDVLELKVPDEDAIVADHNTYGLGWVNRFYKKRIQAAKDAGISIHGSDAYFECIHDAYKLLYEHRGLIHALGYGHSGKVRDTMSPELEGSGRNKRIKSWDYFDRHFGPLLDGSAFKDTRRGPRPIEFLYLTINPEWPADYVKWGQPGYEIEFVNVVSQMEKHFREKGWTRTRFEMFFNHKKRYKVFCWDGDETRFPKDNTFFKTFGTMLRKAIPKDSPVKFCFRHDASWLMRQQFDELKGIVDFWVCGGGIFAFYPEAPAMLKGRGDTVWVYGGAASAYSPTLAFLDMPVKTWMYGIDGYIFWLFTNPGKDPWFAFEGGRTGMIFQGDRFGLDGPIPGVRLKLQRNCLQDLAVLDLVVKGSDAKSVREKVAELAGAKPIDWWNPNAKSKKLPPWEWSNASLGEDSKKPVRVTNKLDGRWWQKVRAYALKNAGEVKP